MTIDPREFDKEILSLQVKGDKVVAFLNYCSKNKDYISPTQKEKIPAMEKELEEYTAKIEEMHSVYLENPWSRFYMVPGGHIHKTMYCSTCNKNFKATAFSWITDLSGMTEKDAVDKFGAVLCTVCFPSAPISWTNHYEEMKKEKAKTECPGSRKRYHEDLKHRVGYHFGNWATCHECKEVVSLTNTYKLRAHQPKQN